MANLLRYDTTYLKGDVTITDKQGEDEDHFIITVTGNGDGTFKSLTATYQGVFGDWKRGDFAINGNVGTLTVNCSSNTRISLTGEFVASSPTPTNLLGDYIEVDYGLTNCEIIGDKPVKVKTGQSYTFNFKANANAELTEIQVNYQNEMGDWVVKQGTISEDKQTGNITFELTTGAADLTVYANADVVQPPTPTNLLTYDTTGLTGDVTITDQQGTDAHHFNVTVTGNGDGTFSNLKATYQDWDGNYIKDEPFNVSGNVATLTVYCSKGDEITITGSFIQGVRELQITNNIQNTTASSVASETNYTVTVTGNAKGMFNGTPTITYGGETYNMTVTNQTATAIVPIATESVIINGEYLLGDYIEVDYGLTNCEIIGDKPVKVKTGQSYTFNFKANANAELTEIQVNYQNEMGDWVVKQGTISEDKQTGNITFELTTGAADLTVYANADVVQPPTIKNYGAINVYIVTLANLDEFAKKRFFVQTGETETGTKYSEVNLGQYVNRIKRIFTTVPVGGDDVMKCGNYNTGINVKYPDSDVITLDFGNVELTGANGNNEDFNAQVQMFIPCRGVVTVDSKYIGKTINLTIKVNVITGDSVALLSCDGVTFQIESFSLSRDVLYRLGTDLNVVGGEQWNEQILYGLEPYVLITENLTVNVPVNNTQENVTINAVTGFAQFANVNLNTANLLVDEYDEIVSKLETGVYL